MSLVDFLLKLGGDGDRVDALRERERAEPTEPEVAPGLPAARTVTSEERAPAWMRFLIFLQRFTNEDLVTREAEHARAERLREFEAKERSAELERKAEREANGLAASEPRTD